MGFIIRIQYEGKTLRLDVANFYHSEQIDRFRVSGKNRSIVLESNYPLIKSQGKKKKISWKLIEGTMTNPKVLYDIIFRLEQNYKDEPDEPWVMPYKR